MWLLIILSISTVKIPVCTFLLVTWPAGAVNLRSVVMSMSVCVLCLSVCLSVYEDISGTTRAIFTNVLPMSVARSSYGMLTIDRIAYQQEGSRECRTRAKCNLRLNCYSFCIYNN